MNGADPEILTGWMDAYDRAQADDAVKVIVVTGRGRAWCAGAAMAGLQDLGESGGMDDGSGAKKGGGAKKEAAPEPDASALPTEPHDPENGQIIVDGRGRPINHALWITKPIIVR